MEKLKSCPFCGQELLRDDDGDWEHINNGCILSWIDSQWGAIFFENHPDNIKAWNRRAE